MATLSVLKFNDPYGADRVLIALQGLQERSGRRTDPRGLHTNRRSEAGTWGPVRRPRKTDKLQRLESACQALLDRHR